MPIPYKKNRAMSRILRNKFHADPAQHIQAKPEPATVTAAAEPLSAEIPESYNDTYARAIPKDPQNTFVYWEMPKNEAADNGMEANGKTHTGNGEAEAIKNKVNGGMRRGGNLPPAARDNDGNNQDNHQNNNYGQNQAQYYDFESNSWRNGDNIPQQWDNNGGGRDNNLQQQWDNNGGGWDNIPQRYENSTDNNQSYHNDSDNSYQNAQHQPAHQHNHDYGGHQDSHQTYQPDDFSRWRNGRRCRQNHDNQPYYGNSEYNNILSHFAQPGNTGSAYLETPGVIDGRSALTAVNSILLDICKSQARFDIAGYSTLLDICKSQVRLDTAEYSILLDICKSQVNRNNAVFANLSSGVLYKKNAAAPPPHLSSGILYKNTAAAERP